jgi:hypothetical protein
MIVLDVNNFIQEVPLMMVIDEGYRACDFPVFFQLFLQQFLADQIANGFRPVCVFSPLDKVVEIGKQGLFQGDPESDYVRHILLRCYSRLIRNTSMSACQTVLV